MNTNLCAFGIMACMPFLISCRKEFLDAKPSQSLVVPRTLDDYQAILDHDMYVNGSGTSMRGPVPALGEISADNYYVLDEDFNNRLTPQLSNYYVWSEHPYTGDDENSWNYPYLVVFYSNVVLDGLKTLDRSSEPEKYDLLTGEALFTRAHAFYQLAQVFAPFYIKDKAATEPGIPLRLSADINENNYWATCSETYNQILKDLLEAIPLLADRPLIKTRPSKAAAYGMVSRVYQTMQVYDLASIYADSCLQIQHDILDYNQLNANLTYPFAGGEQENPEVIYSCNMVHNSKNPINPLFAKTDSTLYSTYADQDLRKKVFFRESNGQRFKGSYAANTVNFAGIAVDEILLIQAECLARQGQINGAMDALNELMSKRWDNHSAFIPILSVNADEALSLILRERRKELLFRGLRWTDLRRLNAEGMNIHLYRKVNNKVYDLPPNDPRYTLPIPDIVRSFQ